MKCQYDLDMQKITCKTSLLTYFFPFLFAGYYNDTTCSLHPVC